MSDESPLQQAIQAHKGGRLSEAEALYRGILAGNPADGDALNFLGMLTCQSGNARGAIGFLRQSVAAVPDNPHAWINLGTALVIIGENAEARAAFSRATELAPDLPAAWYNLGVCHGRCRQPHEAAAALQRALKLEPGYVPAYAALALLLYRLGDYAQAAELYRDWLTFEPDNPMALHMLAASSGAEPPARADDRYLTILFDDFAETFDESLGRLDYRAPQLIAAALSRSLAPGTPLAVLDAGCGTGLCGPLLRPLARRLAGVDLSVRMIEKARERGVYDELVVEELSRFMRSRPGEFDAVVSADTLVYFGALEEPLAAARECLRPQGVIGFTVEALAAPREGESYRLLPHGRYAHAERYVREALAGAGFPEVTVEAGALRIELEASVTGHVVLARLP